MKKWKKTKRQRKVKRLIKGNIICNVQICRETYLKMRKLSQAINKPIYKIIEHAIRIGMKAEHDKNK